MTRSCGMCSGGGTVAKSDGAGGLEPIECPKCRGKGKLVMDPPSQVVIPSMDCRACDGLGIVQDPTWKTQNKPCDECAGTGNRTACKFCRGTGEHPYEVMERNGDVNTTVGPCPKCRGTGQRRPQAVLKIGGAEVGAVTSLHVAQPPARARFAQDDDDFAARLMGKADEADDPHHPDVVYSDEGYATNAVRGDDAEKPQGFLAGIMAKITGGKA